MKFFNKNKKNKDESLIDKQTLTKLNKVKEPEPVVQGTTLYSKFVNLHIYTDSILDNIITHLTEIEKITTDNILMRYIYKLKVNRNKIKHYRNNFTYCKYKQASNLIIYYDKCFEKCHKIIKRLLKSSCDCAQLIETEFDKIQEYDKDQIHYKTNLQLLFDNKCHDNCH
ncbi:putative ORFan [Tupanvirus deep ocean]|uniref:ORFan n=2 Tax=Tupanvirus TaxID=2094720 RepID=A0AC62A725_9VIRU|nr:putative ORFan [Tupanvirus deep ocean]QKU33447.1 putative ORFan [Tupanvirus deep ocean]